ncbi:MAG: FAD binding domain-containing protein [Hyphomicrobiaceae bacterium]
MTTKRGNPVGKIFDRSRRKHESIPQELNYARVESIGEVLDLLSQSRWRILAGGTDFYPAQRDRPVQDAVVDITGLQELRAIELKGNYWRIGAGATWSDLLATELPQAFAGLKLAAREVGSIQIQNRATIVGNICNASPAADGVPPLLTLDAEVEIVSRRGSRRLPVNDFILGNRKIHLQADEMVTAIVVPQNAAEGSSSFLKLGSRRHLVISIVIVACRLSVQSNGKIDAAAVSVGACSAVAQRLDQLEKRLIDVPVEEAANVPLRNADLKGLTPIDDVRATSAYRLSATKELVSRVVAAAAKEL